jgi:hypothetical protein
VLSPSKMCFVWHRTIYCGIEEQIRRIEIKVISLDKLFNQYLWLSVHSIPNIIETKDLLNSINDLFVHNGITYNLYSKLVTNNSISLCADCTNLKEDNKPHLGSIASGRKLCCGIQP